MTYRKEIEKIYKKIDSLAQRGEDSIMDFRDYVSGELQNSRSSDIESASNAALRETVDNFVADAKRNSPKFALWYDRFLEQDGFGVYK
jgi:hypothetical protein